MIPKKTAWSHLPNAGHIDRVLASVKAHPEAWAEAWNAVWDAVWDEARNAAWDEARDAFYNAARTAAFCAARDEARSLSRSPSRSSAWDAILALIAYDDCAQYLDMPSDKLKVWAILSENPAAILLLPAVIAFEKISELELA